VPGPGPLLPRPLPQAARPGCTGFQPGPRRRRRAPGGHHPGSRPKGRK
jgi:hypothetical protein